LSAQELSAAGLSVAPKLCLGVFYPCEASLRQIFIYFAGFLLTVAKGEAKLRRVAFPSVLV
jgi:hypothetical protein